MQPDSRITPNANLRGANLSDTYLRGANLRGADLRGADISNADLRGADISNANLRGANLRGADLRGADISDTYLSNANLSGANLKGANLKGANLSGAYLSDAYLSGADFTGAIIHEHRIKRLLANAQRASVGAGYTFLLFEMENTSPMVSAGCRFLTVADYRAHVAKEYPDTDKARETLRILDYFDAVIAGGRA